MSTINNVVSIDSVNALGAAVRRALESFETGAAVMDQIKATYLETLASPADYDPAVYVAAVAEPALAWFNERRVDIADYLGEGASWKDATDYSAVDSAMRAFQQKLARDTGGMTFALGHSGVARKRLTVSQYLDGLRSEWFLDASKYNADATGNVTASAQSGGAAESSPEPVQFNGTEFAAELRESEGVKGARSAMLGLLREFPELTKDAAIRRAFNNAMAKVDDTGAVKTAQTKRAQRNKRKA